MSDHHDMAAPASGRAIDRAGYAAMYARSLSDPDGFWREQGQRLDWVTAFTKVQTTSFDEADFGIRWFADGVLNVSANCLDRHLPARAGDAALIWEGDEPGEARRFSYGELHEAVCRFANVLRGCGFYYWESF